eukprot:367876-Prymnesium_polylepis.1
MAALPGLRVLRETAFNEVKLVDGYPVGPWFARQARVDDVGSDVAPSGRTSDGVVCVYTRGCGWLASGDDDADHDRVAALVPTTMVPKMKVNEGCGCACIRENVVAHGVEDADHDRVAA